VTSLWRTQYGFYFTVPDDCTEADLQELFADMKKEGRNRNV
jgi:hypothetical protein